MVSAVLSLGLLFLFLCRVIGCGELFGDAVGTGLKLWVYPWDRHASGGADFSTGLHELDCRRGAIGTACWKGRSRGDGALRVDGDPVKSMGIRHCCFQDIEAGSWC